MTQVLVNAMVSAATYLLVGIGFSLVYTTARFFHFAHGMILTLGAYACFTLMEWVGMPQWVAFLGGIAASTLVGVAVFYGVHRPLRRRGASPSVLLLASLGLYVALQAAVSLLYGAGTKTFRSRAIPEGLQLIGARITIPQIGTLVVSGVCCILMWLFLRKTQTGRAIQAVACDPALAEAQGISQDRVELAVFAVGSAMAGIASILIAYDSDLTPTMGFRVLLMGMVAVIIGGVGSVPGAALGAVLLGLVQHFSAWWISSQWQDAIVFVLLIVFLLTRPQGFMGKPLRRWTV